MRPLRICLAIICLAVAGCAERPRIGIVVSNIPPAPNNCLPLPRDGVCP